MEANAQEAAMMEDIRNHDAAPTREESEWISSDILSIVFRAAVLAVIALSVGVSATLVIDQAHQAPTVASAAKG
jgi:hypothetical protein